MIFGWNTLIISLVAFLLLTIWKRRLGEIHEKDEVDDSESDSLISTICVDYFTENKSMAQKTAASDTLNAAYERKTTTRQLDRAGNW